MTRIGTLALAVAAALGPAAGGPDMMTLGERLVFHVPVLATGADAAAFERQALATNTAGTYLLQADRGGRKGEYVLAEAGPSAEPASGDPFPSLRPFVTSWRRVEYRLLAPAVAGPLPAIDVLGMHYHRVRPDRREAFERFVQDHVHPALANLRPDLRVLYYRATAGGDEGEYVALFALTRASRDKYWPGGSDSDDLRAAFRPVQPLTKELRTFLVEGSYLDDPKFAAAIYESREWSDFVVLSE